MNPELASRLEAINTKRWIEAILSNDESSTDQELVEHFMSYGIAQEEATQWVAKRDDYLRGIL